MLFKVGYYYYSDEETTLTYDNSYIFNSGSTWQSIRQDYYPHFTGEEIEQQNLACVIHHPLPYLEQEL